MREGWCRDSCDVRAEERERERERLSTDSSSCGKGSGNSGENVSFQQGTTANMQNYRAQQKPFAQRPSGDSLSHVFFFSLLFNLCGHYVRC